MTNAVAAIPTRYGGVNFRSRLEARWAAMFDLLGWQWDYEPLDLGGYIPDFVLLFDRPILVEVKPALARVDYAEAFTKIEASGWEHESWVVGCSVTTCSESAHAGYLRHPAWGMSAWWTAEIEYHRGHWTPHTMEGGWGCRVCDEAERKIYCSFNDVPHKRSDLESCWREAGNRVQWRAVTPR